MSPGFRKFLLVLGALSIAAATIYAPWTYLGRLTGSAEYAYFLLSIYWAPGALVLGLAWGFLFASAFWPRKRDGAAGPGNPSNSQPGQASIEA